MTTGDAEEAAMKRALAARSAETYVLASQDVIRTASGFPVLALSAVAGIVTDAPPGQTLDGLTQQGTMVI